MRPLEFRIYRDDPKLCVVQNLTAYLQRTSGYRDIQNPQLFISYQRPFHPVTKDTVSRWINDAMKKAGLDMTKYVTHSCRAAASSALLKRRVPVSKLLNACGWSSERTFACHYKKDIAGDTTVAEDLLRS